MRMKKIAIIGASIGQRPICEKTKEMGLFTYCFAYDKGAVCKDIVDRFYPISIMDKDRIVDVCRKEHVEGVVSNASDLTAEVAAYVAEQLGLNGTPYGTLMSLHDKFHVRSLTQGVKGLEQPLFYRYAGEDKEVYPCVVKPVGGSAKRGVSFVQDAAQFTSAIEYASSQGSDIIVEEYIDGKELSVESLSYHGEHHVMQITDKDSSSAPHFVELGHHQPALLSVELKDKIERIIPRILANLGYTNGASHIELKYRDNQVYLIEVNLRGGGDDISNKLVNLSSGIDYLRGMIEVALDTFEHVVYTHQPCYAGIYYLCKQTANLLPFMEDAPHHSWFVEGKIISTELIESTSNYERNGYVIYQSSKKIIPTLTNKEI